jgi:hypothetical protein
MTGASTACLNQSSYCANLTSFGLRLATLRLRSGCSGGDGVLGSPVAILERVGRKKDGEGEEESKQIFDRR